MKIENAHQFLKALHGDNTRVICTKHPERDGLRTKSFHLGAAAGSGEQIIDLPEFIEKRNGIEHIYYTLNRVKAPVKKKPSREDIEDVIALQVDIDPDPDLPIADEQARILALLTTNLPKGVPEPSIIVFSGGGYQAIWLLEDPIHIGGDIELAEDAKLYNMWLEHMLGGDSCHNIDRVLRLPFTMNVKTAKGREPTMASLLKADFDLRYPISAFRKATNNEVDLSKADYRDFEFTEIRCPVDGQELLDVGVPQRLLDVIANGPDKDNPKENDNSRSGWEWDVIKNLGRAGIASGTIVGIMLNKDWGISDCAYNDGQGKPRPNPMRHAKRQVAKGLTELQLEKEADEKKVSDELDYMNQRHAVLLHEGGKTRVLTWDFSEVDENRLVSITQSAADIKLSYSNRLVEIPGDPSPKFVPLGNWWLNHPKRAQYHALRFDPSTTNPVIEKGDKQYLNLWRGYGVDATAGEWIKMYYHIKNVLACGNDEHFKYILNWAAWTIQNPDKPAEVALVFKGGKGTGKGFFGRTMRRLFGQHGLQISSKTHLTGRFNAHMRDCVLLFADEAIAPGDADAEAVLKMLITEQTLPVEGKGQNLITAPNRMHLIMASNNDFVVPASHDERRYAVFDVAPKDRHRGDSYFKALAFELENGGYEAMLHDLKNMDLGDWHPRQGVPQTSALREQQMENLTPIEGWLLGVLQDGIIPGERPPGQNVDPLARLGESLYDDIRAKVPEVRFLSNVKLSKALDPWFGNSVRVGGRMTRVFEPLGKMRALWDERRWPMDWPADDEDRWDCEPDTAQGEVPF